MNGMTRKIKVASKKNIETGRLRKTLKSPWEIILRTVEKPPPILVRRTKAKRKRRAFVSPLSSSEIHARREASSRCRKQIIHRVYILVMQKGMTRGKRISLEFLECWQKAGRGEGSG